MMNENFRGLKKYENLLQRTCNIEDFDDLSNEEWEGCLGVACVKSVIDGVPSNLFALSRHLDIPYDDFYFQNAFERLKRNGIFHSNYNLYKDLALNSKAKKEIYRTPEEVENKAWCSIAGVASGFTGIRIDDFREDN